MAQTNTNKITFDYNLAVLSFKDKHFGYFKNLYSSKFTINGSDKISPELSTLLQEIAFEHGTAGLCKLSNGEWAPVVVKVLARDHKGDPINAVYYTINLFNQDGTLKTIAESSWDIETDESGSPVVVTLDFRPTWILTSKSANDLYGEDINRLANHDAQISKAVLRQNDKFYINQKSKNKSNFEIQFTDPATDIIVAGDGGHKTSFSGMSSDLEGDFIGESSVGVVDNMVTRLNSSYDIKNGVDAKDKLLQQLKTEMGIRINTALGNKSRTNTLESESEESQFVLAEKTQSRMLDAFASRWKKINGETLEIENNIVGNMSFVEAEVDNYVKKETGGAAHGNNNKNKTK